MKRFIPLFLAACVVFPSASLVADEELDRPPTELRTRWSGRVSSELPHPEHPRPGLVRASWMSLNGPWSYAVLPRLAAGPSGRGDQGDAAEGWDGRILVPFPVESALSGVGRRVGPEERLWYRRTFAVPDDWNGQRVMLRFGAVDWRAEVWVDGRRAGAHEGGYDPFSFDVTSLLADGAKPGVEHEVIVAVWDPTDAGPQPRGKQVREPHGIWYTPVTGIWQSVWLEAVPPISIDGVVVTEVDPSRGDGNGRVRVAVQLATAAGAPPSELPDGLRVEATVLRGSAELATATAGAATFELDLDPLERWSPDDPVMHDMRVRLLDGERAVDDVHASFALRTIAVVADGHGVPRLHLNGEPLFQLGLLDQGYWPDGLYTAPTDEALRYDLEMTKRLGYNLVRKHVKVEPERWYHHCDRLGLLVWQDIPSGGPFIGPADPDAERTAESAAIFELEAARIVDALRHHPSIVSWVLFNEGWGQYDTERLAAWLERHDPTRLVNATSGWADRGVGAMHDVHVYPGPGAPPAESRRAAVLGEFGGLGLPLAGHTWQDESNWGYRSYESRDDLVEAYLDLLARLRLLIADGLAAAVYTQTTDVEIEVNGVMTYDRAVVKLGDPRVVAANRRVYLPPPRLEVVVPSSRESRQAWRYTLEEPPTGWFRPGFDDAGWLEALGGFGTAGTPGAVLGTTWSSEAIWLRRDFRLDAVPERGTLCLLVHHDEDAEVYLNGHRVATLEGYTTSHVVVPLADHARGRLVPGRNHIAVHCRQTRGGQYVDVGLGILHDGP